MDKLKKKSMAYSGTSYLRVHNILREEICKILPKIDIGKLLEDSQ